MATSHPSRSTVAIAWRCWGPVALASPACCGGSPGWSPEALRPRLAGEMDPDRWCSFWWFFVGKQKGHATGGEDPGGLIYFGGSSTKCVTDCLTKKGFARRLISPITAYLRQAEEPCSSMWRSKLSSGCNLVLLEKCCCEG